MMLSAIRDRLDYQSALLGVVVLMTCAALALAYQLTREPIRAALENDLLKTFSQVLPQKLYDNNLMDSQSRIRAPWGEFTWYQASREGKATAAVFPLTATGYAGDIEMLIGIEADGRIAGVRVLVHRETPGLGDKIEVNRDSWITGFNGKSLGQPPASQWRVKKDGGAFDQFTGATITPRAIVAAIRRALEFHQAEKQAFLTPVGLAKGDPHD